MTDTSAPVSSSWPRAIGIGILVAILTGAVTVTAFLTGVSPFPMPPSLAFAEIVLGGGLPVPVGLLFHIVYVTFWSCVFLMLFPHRGFLPALALAAVLWLIILYVFFPIFGWGILGLDVGPQLIVASAIPHFLFALFLWGLHRLIPGR